tara:strand:- start:153 stop:473 length:321 start_codon:yes stop_codon:yes gene_type:complete
VTDNSTDVVIVEIYGQRYPIRSSLDASYVTKLANYVDQKMQAASDRTRGGDSVRIAVLAALNIADEFMRNKTSATSKIPVTNDTKKIVLQLEQLVDTALSESSQTS